jgi:hypothetical protein
MDFATLVTIIEKYYGGAAIAGAGWIDVRG